jgi:hypothetical protein
MTRSPNGRPPATAARAALRILPGMLGLSVLAGLTAGAGRSVEGPSAEPSAFAARDTDQDGLLDVQERLMRTRARSADTDGDGYSDLEELARHSSPRFLGSTPQPIALDVGAVAHGRDGLVRAVFAFYSADGSFADKHLTVGAFYGNRVIQVPADVLWRTADIRILPAREAPGRLLVVDLPIQPAIIYGEGQVDLFASVVDAASGASGRYDSLDLILQGNTIYHRATISRDELAATQGAQNMVVGQGTGSLPSPSVLVPLHGEREGSVPVSTPGEICMQRSVVVGVGHGVIVNEVVSSECVSGWEGTCAAGCSGQVGSTYTSRDPVVYAGG